MQPILTASLPREVSIVLQLPYASPGYWRLYADPATAWLGRVEWRSGEGRDGSDPGAQRALAEWQRALVLPDCARIARTELFTPAPEALVREQRYKDYGPRRWVVRIE